MSKWYLIGPFENESSSSPTPPPPDGVIEFIVLVSYLSWIYSFDFDHLQFSASDDSIDKAAIYFYHYTFCIPGKAYLNVASLLYSFNLTDFKNLNWVLGVCLFVMWFLLINYFTRIVWLKLYLALLVVPGLLYIILKVFVWLFS